LTHKFPGQDKSISSNAANAALTEAAVSPVPFRRLGVLYFVYFCELGIFVPFWTLYLASRGYEPEAISLIMAAMMITRIIGSTVWGWLGDKIRKRLLIVRLGLVGAMFGFLLQFTTVKLSFLIPVLCLYSFFWNAVLPQIEAYTLRSLGNNTHIYGGIRLWGSVGFIVVVLTCGWLFDRIALQWVPIFMLFIMACVLLVSFFLKDETVLLEKSSKPIWHLLKNFRVLSFFTVCLLMMASHGPFYVFYSIYLQDNGYSTSSIGILWSLGVVAEIRLFIVMHHILKRFGVRVLLLASLVIAAVRWILVGAYVESFLLMMLAQTMHAATYAVFHSASIQFIHQHFGNEHAGKGQALYASIGYGLGNALGAWYAGQMWGEVGPAEAFYFAAVFNLLAIIVCIVGLQSSRPSLVRST